MHPWPASSQGSVRHHISRCGPEFGNGKEEGEVLKKLYGEINIQHHRVEIISGSVPLSGHRLISGFSSVSCCSSRVHTCYHFPCFIVNVAQSAAAYHGFILVTISHALSSILRRISSFMTSTSDPKSDVDTLGSESS